MQPVDLYAIGIDVGGTNIRAAVITPDGATLASRHAPTPHNAHGDFPAPHELTAAIVACAQPLFNDFPILGVGVGCGGQFDPREGTFKGINTQDPAYVGYPLAGKLAEAFCTPVYVDNDVKAAAYGEARHGAGAAYAHLLCVAVGTGIGGALILDGRLYHGASGLAGHVGQLTHPDTGEHIERVAGGVWMSRSAARAGILPMGGTTEQLFAQMRAGDPLAEAFITESALAFGRALAGLVHVLAPQALLVGGSVGIQPEYLAALNAGLSAARLPAWGDVRALPMQLGEAAGRIGAAMFVYDAHSSP